MNKEKFEPRYKSLLRKFRTTRLFRYWNSHVVSSSSKLWQYSKKALWGLSVTAIVLLVPLMIETTLEGEARLSHLNSQISGDVNPNVEYRPY
jgi:hypothetical protein